MPTLTCAGVRTLGLSSSQRVGGVHRRHLGQRLDHREADEVRERDLAAAATGEVVVDDDAVVDHQLGRRSARTEVAVGTSSEASMLVTTRAAGPRSFCTSSADSASSAAEGRCATWAYGRGRRLGGRDRRRHRRAAPRTSARPWRAASRRARRRARRGGAAGAAWRAARVRRRAAGAPCRGWAPAVPRRPARRRGRAVGGGLVGLVALEEVPPRRVDRVLVLLVLLEQLVHEPLVGTENGTRRVRIRHLGHAGIAHFRCGS